MTRKTGSIHPSGYSILLVDDSLDYLEATRLLLEREGHRVWVAANGPEALTILQEQAVDLILLDYCMPGMNGEQVVEQVRQFNPYVQVILQTGYATEQPPRELLRRLDIQGYYDKSEGAEKLLLWTDVGLKAAHSVNMLCKSRQGLRYILDVAADMHRIQPLEDLLQGILLQIAGLLGATNSFLAVLPEEHNSRPGAPEPEGFVALLADDTDLVIRASTGRFVGSTSVEPLLDPERLTLVQSALQYGMVPKTETTTVIPLTLGQSTLGVVYLDRPVVLKQDLELLQIFAHQASLAIQNVQLYETALLDPITGVHARGDFEKCLLRNVRDAFRSQQSLALVMVDLDRTKQIKDSERHLAGDEALAMVAKALRQATRATDVVGRYSGDQFGVIVSQAGTEGALRFVERVSAFLAEKFLPGAPDPLAVEITTGYSVLEPHNFPSTGVPRPIPQAYLQSVALCLVQHADQALHRANKETEKQVVAGEPTIWPPIPSTVA